VKLRVCDLNGDLGEGEGRGSRAGETRCKCHAHERSGALLDPHDRQRMHAQQDWRGRDREDEHRVQRMREGTCGSPELCSTLLYGTLSLPSAMVSAMRPATRRQH
jgi:hypothetical protein